MHIKAVSPIVSKTWKPKEVDKPESDIIGLYEATGPDYVSWSKDFHMHFGYYKRGMNPFNRNDMLERTNDEVYRRLDLSHGENVILDLGCGVGATISQLSAKHPQDTFYGFTIVPWQVKEARKRLMELGNPEKAVVFRSDYRGVPVDSGGADGVYAIESACHASGPAKEDLLEEIYRLLKPGKKVVIADGFVKNRTKSFSSAMKKCLDVVASNWAVKEFASIEAMTEAMSHLGFKDITAEEVSWHVAPSVLHTPFVAVTHTLRKLWRGEKINERSRKHIISCILAPVLGANTSKFGYYFVSATKPE